MDREFATRRSKFFRISGVNTLLKVMQLGPAGVWGL